MSQGRARCTGEVVRKWAIRDIEHGKTIFFDTYEEMAAWIKRNQEKMT